MTNTQAISVPAAVIRTEKTPLPAIVRQHDIFNLWSLAIINAFTIYHLTTGGLFQLYFFLCLVYFISDFIFIAVHPACVKSPRVILFHHVAAALYMLIPLYYPHLEWCLTYNMLIEINTWFLIARRTFHFPGVEFLFYTSWFLLRTIWYPYLIYVFTKCYIEESEESWSFINPIMVAPPMQMLFTGLNLHWTINLLKPKSKAGAKQL